MHVIHIANSNWLNWWSHVVMADIPWFPRFPFAFDSKFYSEHLQCIDFTWSSRAVWKSVILKTKLISSNGCRWNLYSWFLVKLCYLKLIFCFKLPITHFVCSFWDSAKKIMLMEVGSHVWCGKPCSRKWRLQPSANMTYLYFSDVKHYLLLGLALLVLPVERKEAVFNGLEVSTNCSSEGHTNIDKS